MNAWIERIGKQPETENNTPQKPTRDFEVSNENAKGEYYLTDIVEIANADGQRCGVVRCPEDEVLGVNSRVESRLVLNY